MKNQNVNMLRITSIFLAILLIGLLSASITHAANTESKYTLITGESLNVGGGYTLLAKQVTVDGEYVWFELQKNGVYVDDTVLYTDDGHKTWKYNNGNFHLEFYLNQVFQGAVDPIAQIVIVSGTIVEIPVPDFSASPRSGKPPLIVVFTDLSTKSPTSWKWDFGDGTTSTAQNPTHTYTKSGIYTATLKATNSAGSNSATKSKYIIITGSTTQKPVAAFTASPTSGTNPLKVQFTDQSTNNPTSWKWDFGDGSATSTTHNPLHTYIKAGSHTVTLTATNAAGSSTVTKTNYITLTGTATQKPVAAFTASPTSGFTPLKVQFTDKSTNNPTSWKWDFGDGTTSTTHNPLHTYIKAGNLKVTFTATNAAGSSTVTKTSYIKITAPVKPVAAFTATPTSGKASLKVQFTDKSTNSPTSWKWTFGDGTTSTTKSPLHTYIKKGKFTVTLTVKNTAGSNTKTMTNYITVK